MDIFKNYGNYKIQEKEYSRWKQNFDEKDLKRKLYLKNNPLSEQEKSIAYQRGKILLNAIDIMDEYSQVKAEDVEIATEIASNQLQSMIYWGVLLAGGFAISKIKLPSLSQNNFLKKHPAEILAIIGSLVAGILTIPIVSMTTKAQIGASKQGRFEAMHKDLSNPSHFAVLTNTQLEDVNKKAKNITLNKEDLKRDNTPNIKRNPFEFIKTINNLIKDRKTYAKQRKEFEDKINENIPENILTESNILNAKKDKQLLTKLVNKIDIASQDYAENIEMLTNIASMALLSTGLGIGFLSNKIMNLCKFNNLKYGNIAKTIITFILTILPSILFSSYFTELQKQGSRIGRFKVKQDLMKDVNNFAYVDDKKLKDIKNVETKENKKTNIFQFFKEAWKDNKEYNKYLKTKAIENKKYNKVVENISLSAEQLNQAKNLQHNTFKMFNKVDDKSQQYAESVEAVGEIIQNTVGRMLKMTGIFLGTAITYKSLFNGKLKLTGSALKMNYSKYIFGPLLGMLCGFIPATLFETYITKEQKKASRVANMMAIKEMDDYKNFINNTYDIKLNQQEVIAKYFKKT